MGARSVPMLAQQIEAETQEHVELRNREIFYQHICHRDQSR
jgi:hypothetical protein